MLLSRIVALAVLTCASALAQSATVLVLRFQNNSSFTDANWIGESIAETLRTEFEQTNQIVLDRQTALEGMKRLGLRPEANFTKASVIRLSQTVEADLVVFGSYDVKLPQGAGQLKNGNIEINAQLVDLRKSKTVAGISETGKVSDLSRYKEHLAWQMLGFIDPSTHATFEQFLGARPLTRLDAEESYIHGLLSIDKEQQKKWLLQAANLDPQFVSAAYELGKFYLDRKDPRQALQWLRRVPATDSRYMQANFLMGVAAYQAGDYQSAINDFKAVSRAMPLHEVYNNLGAAEEQLNLPAALDDLRQAVEGEPADVIYLFNLGAALLRRNQFEEAQQRLQAVADHSPGDTEANGLLAQAESRRTNATGAKPLAPARLKTAMDSTAFRQLKAMLQPKAK